MAKNKQDKKDKEVAALRAQVEALKAQLSETRKTEGQISSSKPMSTGGYTYSHVQNSQNAQAKKNSIGFSTAASSMMTPQDLGVFKKDFTKTLIFSAIIFGFVTAISIILPKISFLSIY